MWDTLSIIYEITKRVRFLSAKADREVYPPSMKTHPQDTQGLHSLTKIEKFIDDVIAWRAVI